MHAANDNDHAHDSDPQTHTVPSGTLDALMGFQPLPEHQPIDDFIAEYLDQLFPIFLQGKIMNLQEDTQALVSRYQLTQATMDQLADKQYDIMYHANLEPEEKREACIQVRLPYCANHRIDANHLYNYTVLQNFIADRIYLLANDRIEGCGSYADDGLFGEAAIAQHVSELHQNGRMLQYILVEFGVGANQSKQIIRTFDDALEKSIAHFLGGDQDVRGPAR